ncbi:MAG: hypothetical protein R3F43_23415 [bacterium]
MAPAQPQLRRWIWSDGLHLVFNAHFLGAILYGLAFYHLLPHVDAWLADRGWLGALYHDAASAWPLWIRSRWRWWPSTSCSGPSTTCCTACRSSGRCTRSTTA